MMMMMRALTIFYSAAATLVLAPTSFLLLSHQAQGFAMPINRSNSSIFMMPLRLDHYLLPLPPLSATTTDTKGTDSIQLSPSSSSSSPRGIVLNTGVGGMAFAGGLMGYVKKGSKASLIAGSVFSGLLIMSALLIRLSATANATVTTTEKKKKKTSRKGNILGFTTSGLLAYIMGKKFLKSGVFIPGGIIAIGASVATVYNAVEVVLVTAKNNSNTPTEIEEDETKVPP